MDYRGASQKRLFGAVLRELQRLGYKEENDRLKTDYRFPDWFARTAPPPIREVQAAAFAHTPCSYNSACFAVILKNGKPSAEAVNQCRALCAPIALEVHDDFVAQWVVAADPAQTREQRRIVPGELASVFKENRETWSGPQLLRAKNIGIRPGPIQRDLFVDAGLLPALEEQVQTRLDHFLKGTLAEAEAVHKKETGQKPDEAKFFRLVFRFVAAKVLRDRGVGAFPQMDISDTQGVLRAVKEYYRDARPEIDNPATQDAVASRLWSQISFANLSVEALAYIYEHTFVDEELRAARGIHSTPYGVARYVAYRLPIEDIPEDERFVVEPCCGHGIFLVAALQRLRELLSGDRSPEERHDYFVRMLRGYDLDPFALEVARLCLMLADFPNRDGWKLRRADVFTSPKFSSAVRRSRVVLCNPPFEDFASDERAGHPNLPPRKPAAILRRVLHHLPPNGLLGFVLPRTFLDGRSYAGLRRQLAERFDAIETVALPDKVFRESGIETALLLCKHPVVGPHTTQVSFTHIKDSEWEKFLKDPAGIKPETETKTPVSATRSLRVVELGEVWHLLRDHPKLKSEVSILHRGIEWVQPFVRDKYISPEPRAGFQLGVVSAKGMKTFQSPKKEYLDMRSASRRRPEAFQLPWSRPKVFMPKARLSRGPWCFAAYADEDGLVCYQNFVAAWPAGPWSVKALTAVLNGPVASAFVATRSDKLDITKTTTALIPLPRLRQAEVAALDGCVEEYLKRVRKPFGAHEEEVKEALLRVDAAVLRGYNLPPPVERRLLNYFRGHERPVPFLFGDYVERLIRYRLAEQTRILEEDEEEQGETWDYLEKALDEDRLSYRKFFS